MSDADLFEVTSSEVNLDGRKLTTAAKVRATIGSPSADDTLIGIIIDRVSALAAQYCNLARDITGKAPTFASETCRATWYYGACRGPRLALPWRTPITAITSVVEDGVTLESSDYQITAGGILLRLNDDIPIGWSYGKIVVVYVAGITATLSTNVQPDLEARVIDQVKMEYLGRDQDNAIRSETIPDVHQISRIIPGGDSLGDSGLLVSVEGALAPYRAHLVA